MSTLDLAAEAGHIETPPRQRSARNNPAMRDGDGSHGDPYEGHDNPQGTDEDIGDALIDQDYAEEMRRHRAELDDTEEVEIDLEAIANDSARS